MFQHSSTRKVKHCSLSCGFPNFVPLDNNIPINEPPSAELLPFKMVFPSFFHIEFNSVFSIFNIKKAFLILKLATFLRAEKVGAKFLQLLPAIGLKNYWEHRSKLKLFFLSQKNNLPRSISGQWTMKVIITINLKCLPSFFPSFCPKHLRVLILMLQACANLCVVTFQSVILLQNIPSLFVSDNKSNWMSECVYVHLCVCVCAFVSIRPEFT